MPNGKRGLGFAIDEVNGLLDVIEELLPIGPHEWDTVEREHALRFPDKDRNKEGLKRKFTTLYLTKLPTGEPNCPPEVRRAKRIYEELKKTSELSDGEGKKEADALESPEDAVVRNLVFQDETETGDEELVSSQSGNESSSYGDRVKRGRDFLTPMGKVGRNKSMKTESMEEKIEQMISLMFAQRQMESDERRQDKIREDARREKEEQRIQQERQQREEEYQRRQEERQRREEERLRREEERQQREDNRFMQMMMMTIAAQKPASSASSTPDFWQAFVTGNMAQTQVQTNPHVPPAVLENSGRVVNSHVEDKGNSLSPTLEDNKDIESK